MDYNEKKSKIIDALLEHTGLQNIVDTATEVLGNPVFVYDLSMKLLAASSKGKEAELIQELFPNHYMSFDDMAEVEQAGIYKQLLSQDTPVYGKFGFYPYRFLGARIRDKNKAVGIAAIIERNAITKEEEELLIVLCKVILFEMEYRRRVAMQTVPYYGLFQDLIEGNILKNEMEERKKALKYPFPKTMKLLYLQSAPAVTEVSLYYIHETLQNSIHSMYSIVYGKQIIALLDAQQLTETILAVVQKVFSGMKVTIGISRPFDTLWNLPKAYEQAKAAVSLSEKLKRDTDVCNYEELCIYHLLDMAGEQCDLADFCNPQIQRLIEYDGEFDTELLWTLEAYLICGKNIRETARRMNVHKNTVYYRLNKIQEICGMDLEDEEICLSLQLTLKILQLAKA